MKKETPEEILKAIHQTLLKGFYMSITVEKRMMNKSTGRQSIGCSSPIGPLSNRELEVFRLIGQGYGTRRMAEELCLSVKTIEAYRIRIKKKLNIKSINKLILYAIQWIQNQS